MAERLLPAIVVVALLGVFSYDTAKLYLPYSGSALVDAIREMTDGCLATSKNSLSGATDQQRRNYCTCVSNAAIPKFTPQQSRDLAEPSNIEKFKSIINECAAGAL